MLLYSKLKKDIGKLEDDERELIKPFTSFKYIKFTLLVISIIAAYYLFNQPYFDPLVNQMENFGYLGIFIAGLLLSFGFTAAFGVGFFLTLAPDNILLAALTGALGALIADVTIFKIMKYSFTDEFESLRKTAAAKRLSTLEKHLLNPHIRHYIAYIFAGLVIASPLPDEIGVTLLAGLNTINTKALSIMCFALHLIGILALVGLGKAI